MTYEPDVETLVDQLEKSRHGLDDDDANRLANLAVTVWTDNADKGLDRGAWTAAHLLWFAHWYRHDGKIRLADALSHVAEAASFGWSIDMTVFAEAAALEHLVVDTTPPVGSGVCRRCGHRHG